MSEGEFDPSGDQAVSSELAGVLPVEFTAFHSQQHRAYLRYAHLQLGNAKMAEEVVDDVFTFLLKAWGQALREASLHGFAWAVLREHVERRLVVLARPVAMVETAWFAALRRTSRERLELLESKLGLYAAIAELSERQYDVVLLSFLLGNESDTVARMMGISPATVRSHIRGARRTLSRKLGVDWIPGEEKEQ
ncbi:RNA polymerase sigma factor [Streptomyces sp. NPDC054904]|uniref:RNA polymerase sigma factor n=1 Tax=unclassified Streptomyces TaxID=2593676 RepID=UPI0024820107|nr:MULTISPECIES: sigma-70 family RNA polymerase sigma factor [unclassified Streptomyces]MDA5282583.1 sigma-70 family RNA polymerase sigma factor [Streptomyces sp. Isolate_45]MDX2391304.1 sigma-70 family RNA polymerase sigma factor [Streptomyces sp. DK15]